MTLILGLGNILLGDEGVGVRVVEELGRRISFPPHIKLVDGGTGGYRLLPVISKARHLLIVDAVITGKEPGTIYRFKYGEIPENIVHKMFPHEVNILEVLRTAEIQGSLPDTIIIGIEPENISSYTMELTEELKNKIPDVIDVIIEQLKTAGIVKNEDIKRL